MSRNPVIRDVAKSIAKSRAQSKGGSSNEYALFFIGDESVGKSSLILQFFDKNEVPKPTLALEYVFFRKSNKSLVKDVFHVWELGGGISSTPMISVLSNLKVNSLMIILMLDLSSLKSLWNTLEACLRAAETAVLENKSISKLEAPHYEKENGQEPFPVPLVIIGGKYDKFQSLEPQKKRIVCQCLRFVAHLNGASIIFYSSNDASLTKKTKEFLINPKSTVHDKVVNLDHNKPLFIPAGTDSFANIEQRTDVNGPGSFEKYKQIFTSQFEQETTLVAKVPDDPALDSNFKEPAIDSLRQRKDEELEFIRHEKKGRRT
ncbi:cytoplasmic dynein 2 light intermediate chain 1 [Bemisia tabaci]